MPNSLMEAMALGMPCISTNCPCGGPRMLIKNNENGILVPVNDEVVLAERIIELIENLELKEKLRLNSKEIINDYGPKKIYSEWEKIIK